MLTPDQIRLQIRACEQAEACQGCLAVLDLLDDVLPQLAAAVQDARPYDDAGRRYADREDVTR